MVYADALGYRAAFLLVDIPAYSEVLQDIALAAANEAGVIRNGDFEAPGAGGPGTADGWQWAHTADPTGGDFLGNPWPPISPDMYAGTRDLTQNQTPGGSACGFLRVGNPHPSPGVLNEAVCAASGSAAGLTTTTVTATGVAWTTDQWKGFDLVLERPGNPAVKKHYRIAGNTAATVTIESGNMLADGFEVGDGYRISRLNYQYWYAGWLSQWIEVEPSSRYNFYFKGSLDASTGGFWAFRWADQNHKEISSWVDPRADWTWPASPGWRQYLNGMYWQDGWRRNIPMLQMTPPPGARYIEIAFGFTDETVQNRTGTILVDDVVVDRVQSPTVSYAKSAPDGSLVILSAKTVTLAPRNSAGARTANYFYIEEADRSSGIRVVDGAMGQGDVREGDYVTVSGVMRTSAATGERYIELNAVPYGTPGNPIRPLGMNTKSIHTDPISLAELVTVCGKVREIAGDGTWFTVADGYARNRAEVRTKVVVDGEPLAGQIVVGDTVTISGVVSEEGADPASAVRVILLRGIEYALPELPNPPYFWRTGFEASEGYHLGQLVNPNGADPAVDQNGWAAEWNPQYWDTGGVRGGRATVADASGGAPAIGGQALRLDMPYAMAGGRLWWQEGITLRHGTDLPTAALKHVLVKIKVWRDPGQSPGPGGQLYANIWNNDFGFWFRNRYLDACEFSADLRMHGMIKDANSRLVLDAGIPLISGRYVEIVLFDDYIRHERTAWYDGQIVDIRAPIDPNAASIDGAMLFWYGVTNPWQTGTWGHPAYLDDVYVGWDVQ